MYFMGIAIILLGALLVNRITNVRRNKSYFIIELPEYKFPSIPRAVKSMCSRGWAYIVKAGTVILLCNTMVQIMQTFTWSFAEAEVASESILATIAQPISYLLVPVVGVASWQLAAAAVTGMIAKENVVGTLAVCFVGLQNLIDTEELALMEGAGAEVAGVMAISKAAALAYLMFNLFTPPCFAALGAMNSEMGDRKWFWGGVGLQLATGFTVAFLAYQLGTLITEGTLGAGFLPGLAAIAVFGGIIGWLCAKADQKQPVRR
jgi:ferrous iron transport protein B